MYWFLTDDGEGSWSSRSEELESEVDNLSESGCRLILRRCCKLMVVNTSTRFTVRGGGKNEGL